MKIFSLILIVFLFTALGGCRKLIEIDTPPNQLTVDKVFNDSSSVLAALLNTYAAFNSNIYVNYAKYMSIYVDDMNYTSGDNSTLDFEHSTVSAANGTDLNIWKNLYFVIYQCNDIIGRLKGSKAMTAETASETIGEALFLRAYAYYYLTNTFGPVPLILQVDVNNSSLIARTDSATIYQQIIDDLTQAENSLSSVYRGEGKVRANKWAAAALLARVYLQKQDWVNAETTASAVINSELYGPLDAPANVFAAGSNEAILQFWTQFGYIADANSYIPSTFTIVPNYTISGQLMAAFEPGDLRKLAWTDSTVVTSGSPGTYYFFYKYHNKTSIVDEPEYLMGLRLSEQYLIRAEALAQQGKIPDGIADLNVIRNRAGLPNTAATTQQDLISAIFRERRLEFFGEWGFRFIDLKRSGMLDAVMTNYKSTWTTNSDVLPIPQNELTYNPNLTQNPGY